MFTTSGSSFAGALDSGAEDEDEDEDEDGDAVLSLLLPLQAISAADIKLMTRTSEIAFHLFLTVKPPFLYFCILSRFPRACM